MVATVVSSKNNYAAKKSIRRLEKPQGPPRLRTSASIFKGPKGGMDYQLSMQVNNTLGEASILHDSKPLGEPMTAGDLALGVYHRSLTVHQLYKVTKKMCTSNLLKSKSV